MELSKICSPLTPQGKSSLDFTFYKHTTFIVDMLFKDGDNNPIDLTNLVVEFNIADNKNETVFTLNSTTNSTLGSSISIIGDSEDGAIQILITDEEVDSFSFDCGYWWLTLNTSSGDKFLRGKGKLFIKFPG